MTTFGARLAARVADLGPLCVGIDPHAHLLDAWELPDTAAGAERFGRDIVEAAVGRVAVVKPQVAFFERHGAAGYAALERVLADARAAGLLTIADAKRGDVGTSVAGYGEAWLSPGSPLESDAMTVSAFQGLGSLDALLDHAARHGKGAFVLCATSNPEARALQLRRDDEGVTVAAAIEQDAAAWNARQEGAHGSLGLVVGATIVASDFGLTLESGTPILAPGFGYQGAKLGDISDLYPSSVLVLAAVSRSVTGQRGGVADAIDAAKAEIA